MGQPNPELTVTSTGLVAGEDASVLTVAPRVATTATPQSPAVDYVITVDGAAADNYAITYAPGTLSVINITEPGYVGAVAYVSNQDTFNGGASDDERSDERRTQLLAIEGDGIRSPQGVR